MKIILRYHIDIDTLKCNSWNCIDDACDLTTLNIEPRRMQNWSCNFVHYIGVL